MLWIWFGLGSAVFYAISALIGKKVMSRAHALEYAGSQGLYGLLLLFLLPFIDLHLSFGIYAALYVLSVVLAAGNLYYLKSIRHSDLSSAMPLMNISPLFLLIIAFLLLGERPLFMDIVGVLLLLTGAYIAQLAGIRTTGFLAPFRTLLTSRYAMYMIFAMFVFSLAAVMQKQVINWAIPVLSILVITRIFIGINYFLLETLLHGFSEIRGNIVKDGWSIFASSIASFISDLFLLLAMAVPGTLVSLVIPLQRTSTFITSLVGGKLFHEHRLGRKLLGCLVMLLGVLIIAL